MNKIVKKMTKKQKLIDFNEKHIYLGIYKSQNLNIDTKQTNSCFSTKFYFDKNIYTRL